MPSESEVDWRRHIAADAQGSRSLWRADTFEDTDEMSALFEVLERLGREYPDVMYLTNWEVAQLCRSGTSAARFAHTWILRNLTDTPRPVATGGSLAAPALDVRTGKTHDPVGEDPGTYVLPAGVYRVLAQEKESA